MSMEIMTTERLSALLTRFRKRHGAEYHLRRLGFFGSFARREANEKSDIDIVFESDAPNLFTTARMRDELMELLGRPVDLVRLHEPMNPRFKERIKKEAVYV
jgi:predicted nucleotidyltransferase